MELLVVISVLSILMAIGTGVYTKLQQNARDTQRMSDLKVIQSALEQYHADWGFYPFSIGSNYTIDPVLTSNLGNPNPLPPEEMKTYLSKSPSDPLYDPSKAPADNYQYVYGGFGSLGGCDNTAGNICFNYCLFARMENSSNANTYSFSQTCIDLRGYWFSLSLPYEVNYIVNAP